MVPRYDLVNVTQFYSVKNPGPITVQGSKMYLNTSAVSIGEFRGFTGTGKEALTTGNVESDNVDILAVGLSNGKVRRITQHPGYADPIGVSHDDKWQIVLDTRGTNRTEWMDGMRHVPPLNDLIAGGMAASIRNNGNRRFFQPFLLDYCGDRGDYFGQQINTHGDGSPGSVNDPNWNALADPRWSWDGTKIAYHQALVAPPDCGGVNPLPCPRSTAQGGRTFRVMLATFTSRKPLSIPPPGPISDEVPWGTPFVAGTTAPTLPPLPSGNYTLDGKSSGYANVQLIQNTGGTGIATVDATYHNYSDDGCNFLCGSERVTYTQLNITAVHLEWYSNMTFTGETSAPKSPVLMGFTSQLTITTRKLTPMAP